MTTTLKPTSVQTMAVILKVRFHQKGHGSLGEMRLFAPKPLERVPHPPAGPGNRDGRPARSEQLAQPVATDVAAPIVAVAASVAIHSVNLLAALGQRLHRVLFIPVVITPRGPFLQWPMPNC